MRASITAVSLAVLLAAGGAATAEPWGPGPGPYGYGPPPFARPPFFRPRWAWGPRRFAVRRFYGGFRGYRGGCGGFGGGHQTWSGGPPGGKGS